MYLSFWADTVCCRLIFEEAHRVPILGDLSEDEAPFRQFAKEIFKVEVFHSVRFFCLTTPVNR